MNFRSLILVTSRVKKNNINIFRYCFIIFYSDSLPTDRYHEFGCDMHRYINIFGVGTR